MRPRRRIPADCSEIHASAQFFRWQGSIIIMQIRARDAGAHHIELSPGALTTGESSCKHVLGSKSQRVRLSSGESFWKITDVLTFLTMRNRIYTNTHSHMVWIFFIESLLHEILSFGEKKIPGYEICKKEAWICIVSYL